MKNFEGRNLTMLTDLYELTMAQSYFNLGRSEKVVFDVFYRSNPFGNGYVVACGIEDVIDLIEDLHFTDEDTEYLASLGLFSNDFLRYLGTFKFTGNISAVSDGTVVFPMEPIIKVEADICQAQIIETMVLNIVNHQSLIATKAARIMQSIGEDEGMEFGLRRAQGPDAGLYGAKAAYISGFGSTSNVLAGETFGIPLKGTHAHSYIMSFPSEIDAFRAYANEYPQSAILLVDTYDTLGSGVPNAIKVFNELKERGLLPNSGVYGIRLDSGDLAWLSKEARKMLDEAGFNDAIISASSDLDENLIESLKNQGAKITVWGVGTNLITAKDCPALGGVYKLAAVEKDGKSIPKIKLSENPAKVTNPGNKKIIRFIDKETGLIRADLICLNDEEYDCSQDLTLFDQVETWKRKTLVGGTYYSIELIKPVVYNGYRRFKKASLSDSRENCKKNMSVLSEESKRIINPHKVHVDLSKNLWDLKQELIKEVRKEKNGN